MLTSSAEPQQQGAKSQGPFGSHLGVFFFRSTKPASDGSFSVQQVHPSVLFACWGQVGGGGQNCGCGQWRWCLSLWECWPPETLLACDWHHCDSTAAASVLGECPAQCLVLSGWHYWVGRLPVIQHVAVLIFFLKVARIWTYMSEQVRALLSCLE